ncbi:MAG: hypothetical protein QMD53_00275 [Actinomycetota bacterium]|nr:hypothetical protein [Actinomycetota bacterium]
MRSFLRIWRAFSALVAISLIILILIKFIPPLFDLALSGKVFTALLGLLVFVVMPGIISLSIYFILMIPVAYLFGRYDNRSKGDLDETLPK